MDVFLCLCPSLLHSLTFQREELSLLLQALQSLLDLQPAAMEPLGLHATVILKWNYRSLMNQKSSAMPRSGEALPPPTLPDCISLHCH